MCACMCAHNWGRGLGNEGKGGKKIKTFVGGSNKYIKYFCFLLTTINHMTAIIVPRDVKVINYTDL